MEPMWSRHERDTAGTHNLNLSRAKQCGLKDDARGVNVGRYGRGDAVEFSGATLFK